MYGKKVKGLIYLMAIIIVMGSSTLNVFAMESQSGRNDVIRSDYKIQEKIEAKGTSRPSTVWNIATKGEYKLNGTISNFNTVLYSDMKFKGKRTYTIVLKNKGDKELIIKARTLLKTYETYTIKAGKNVELKLSNMDTSTEFYLTFQGSSYSGHIA